MKKTFFGFLGLLFFAINSFAQVSNTALRISSEKPMTGQKINFSYNSAITLLNNSNAVELIVYAIKDGGWEVIEPLVIKKEKQFTGSFTIPTGTSVVAFGIKNDKKTDNNKGMGYLFPVYEKSGKIVTGYYSDMASLYAGMGEYLVGMDNSSEAAVEVLADGAAARPELKNDRSFVAAMVAANSRLYKTEALEKNTTLLDDFGKKTNPDYKDLDFLTSSYKRMKMDVQSAEFAALQETKFPGEVKKANELKAFLAEKNAESKAKLFVDFETKYPFKKDDKMKENYISSIANAFARQKKYDEFLEWNNKLSPAKAAANLNNVSYNMAVSNEEMDAAKKMSLIAVNFAKNQMSQSADKKAKEQTLKSWEESREQTYSMYADTYAYISQQMGEFKTAHLYALDAARLSKFENKEYNERYVLALEKVEQPTIALPIVEKLVREGHATESIKAVLKTMYTAKNGSENGFDLYLTSLEKEAKIKRKAVLFASMINEPAPAFSLNDTEGKLVSLADLKGKTILVDFWATWCGPCIASMPGLNIAVTKHKDNKDVQFLFVDTWEQVKDKTQNAVDFMQKKNYPFYILMDTEDKMVADYKVSGIPTKFIIDKNGNIRFKVIGFEGNTAELAEEIDMMLELASNP